METTEEARMAKKMEEATLRKVRKWLKISGLISGSLTVIIGPVLMMYVEWAPKVRAARGEASASVESMAPAIVELQKIATKNQEWSTNTDKKIGVLISGHTDLDRRLIRCETYIDLLGKRRNFPKIPPKDDAPLVFVGPTHVTVDAPDPPVAQMTPRYKVPTTIKGAKARVKARRKQKCEADDPTCGELE